MTMGMWVFIQRRGLTGLTWASVTTGFAGGSEFATADALKLAAIATGRQTNWHSVLEQTYGFINGLGLALTLFWLARRTPRQVDSPQVRRWTEYYAKAFVLLGITYLNLEHNPETWVKAGAMTRVLAGIPPSAWFALAYLLVALTFTMLLVRHHRTPLPVLTATMLGRGQLLYVVLLWWMVIGNFERALVSFAPERLVTEGVIFINALLCTIGVLGTRSPIDLPLSAAPIWGIAVWRRTIAAGLAAAILL